MGSKVIRSNPNWFDDYIKKLKTLAGKEVAVGYPAGKLNSPYYPTGASVIQIAIWNNYGTAFIPSRPFFDLATVKIQRTFKPIVASDIKLALKGKLPIKKMFYQWGNDAKGIIQQQIADTYIPSNKDSTIAAKQSEHPLIDTGHMQQSTTFVIRERTK